jgi:tRNA threonylcarbamoyladenosine biosynthesis protein TsaB
MAILALDASTELCSVAVGGSGGFVERVEHAGQRHSEMMLPMVHSVLADAGVALAQLEGIAFGAGPGSFTGLRIACGVAQGLAFGAGLPVVGVPTLAAIAEAARALGIRDRVYAALDARMREVYVAAYEYDGARWHERIEAAVVKPDAAPRPPGAGWFGAGNGFAAYADLRTRLARALTGCDATLAPVAGAIGALALPRFAAGEGVPARDATPLYVRHRVALTTAERASGAVL